MTPFNLLLVEDDKNEIKTFQGTLERYRSERKREINLTITTDRDESLNALNNIFDGAIVDLKLKRDEDAGNKILEVILNKFRIPVVVYTANPANVPAEYSDRVKVFPRATVLYDVPLDFLFDMFETGLTNILGGRGHIENAMNRVFWDNIIPQLDTWKKHKSKDKDTEKALLRFIINHIVELVDEEAEKYFPEEMYIAPVISSVLIKTGCILKKQDKDQYYVVLTPACDLTLHGDNFKTDRILVCQIEKTDMNFVQINRTDSSISIFDSDDDDTKKNKAQKIEKAKRALIDLQINRFAPYFHYLPNTNVFQGGFINFRKVETFKPRDFKKAFTSPIAQISSAFTKDIVARFSSYYARQGQPDFDLDNLTL